MNRRIAAVLVALGLALAAGGCGSQSRSAADQVPDLSTRLTSIDNAMGAHRFAIARTRLEALVRDTTSARDSGKLDSASSERILAAAAQLIGALPTVVVTPTPTATPTKAAPTRRTTPVPPKKPAPHHEEHHKGHGHDK
ncbi:MAG: hypothetical protein ACJ72E_08615 [Marmoricola sp.]